MANQCEAWIEGTWQRIDIPTALANPDLSKRCIECYGAVRIHKAGSGVSAHAEHRVGHTGCSLAQHFDGKPRKHPNPATHSAGSGKKDFEQTIVDFFQLSDDKRRVLFKNNTTEPPQKTSELVTRYARKQSVVNDCLSLANGKCGKCKKPAPFRKLSNNEPFLEVHHIRPLSKNGIDEVHNTIALCPNCHRETHDRLSMDADDE